MADLARPPVKPTGVDAFIRALLPPGLSIWAIIAGYLGLFAVLGWPAPWALIVGLVAVWDIQTHPQRHGMGRAIFAIITGALGTALLAFILWAVAHAD